MNGIRSKSFHIDWFTITLYLLLVFFGYLNILSASTNGTITSLFDLTFPFGKQLIFICLSIIIILLILSIEAKFYERFSSIIYLVAVGGLLGLFFFGKKINGAISWYQLGSLTIQPSEFSKFATALGLAKYISDMQTDMKKLKDQLIAVLIVAVPAFLILLQNDAGSTIIFASLIFVFYREGISKLYIIVSFFLILLTVIALKFETQTAFIGISVLVGIHHFLWKSKKARKKIAFPIIIIGAAMLIISAVNFSFKNILQEHHQDRIGLWLRLEKDPVKLKEMRQNISYNLKESEMAISSGGFRGKGYMQGTRTTGKFVPEQHTDYIFSTVGEEWGFIGSSLVVILFVLLITRLLYLAERQKTQFARVYGYAAASILFMHFLVNIGMVMGLIPTIGIPLPFFSYGGSGLWGFTILLFIFINMDANRLNEW